MRPQWGAGEKPPGRKLIFHFLTANLGALLAPVTQKCKRQQVSQRFKIRISLFGGSQKAEFCHEAAKFHPYFNYRLLRCEMSSGYNHCSDVKFHMVTDNHRLC